jgi:hypothetical protein
MQRKCLLGWVDIWTHWTFIFQRLPASVSATCTSIYKAVVYMKNKFSCLLKSILLQWVGGLGGKWGGQQGHNPSMTQA